MTRPLHSIIDPSDMPRTTRSYADPDHAYDLARERRMMTQAERDAEDRERKQEERAEMLDMWRSTATYYGGTIEGVFVDVLDAWTKDEREVALVEYIDGTRATVPRRSVKVSR